MREIVITKRKLKNLYLIKGLKIKEIAKIYDCSEACISKKLTKYKLNKRIEDSYIGKRFGMLSPIKFINRDKNGHAIFECVCDCSKTVSVLGYHLKTGNTKTCGCKSRKYGKNNPRWAGYEEIDSSLWWHINNGAITRNLVFDITIEQAWQLFLDQNRRCALSGVALIFAKTTKNPKSRTASLDRIDSSKGYTLDNIQWIYKPINKMKMNMDEKEFIALCKSIANYN